MPPTIGLVANVYNEINALPGWLEIHTPFFDDVRVLHAGPGGECSDDGTMELLEKWRVPVTLGTIDDGFGAVRTRAIKISPCDYVMILDADERFFPVCRTLTCHGDDTSPGDTDAILSSYNLRGTPMVPPDWDRIGQLGAGLHVEFGTPYDQGARLREMLDNSRPDALCTVRRHWHDFSFKRPTQNWRARPDWQLRVIRRVSGAAYSNAMHESLVGATHVMNADMERGPFFDHFHFTFKRMEVEQRAHDERIYDAIHVGKRPPTRREVLGGD